MNIKPFDTLETRHQQATALFLAIGELARNDTADELVSALTSLGAELMDQSSGALYAIRNMACNEEPPSAADNVGTRDEQIE